MNTIKIDERFYLFIVLMMLIGVLIGTYFSDEDWKNKIKEVSNKQDTYLIFSGYYDKAYIINSVNISFNKYLGFYNNQTLNKTYYNLCLNQSKK